MRGRLVIGIPAWVMREPDFLIGESADDACVERARAIRDGARRHPTAKRHFDRGQQDLRRASDRRLPQLQRLKLLTRAEEAFMRARWSAQHVRF